MSNNAPLSGLWAIILGGSSGFGFATVEKLAQKGMNIAALYRETSIGEKALSAKFKKIISGPDSFFCCPFNMAA